MVETRVRDPQPVAHLQHWRHLGGRRCVAVDEFILLYLILAGPVPAGKMVRIQQNLTHLTFCRCWCPRLCGDSSVVVDRYHLSPLTWLDKGPTAPLRCVSGWRNAFQDLLPGWRHPCRELTVKDNRRDYGRRKYQYAIGMDTHARTHTYVIINSPLWCQMTAAMSFLSPREGWTERSHGSKEMPPARSSLRPKAPDPTDPNPRSCRDRETRLNPHYGRSQRKSGQRRCRAAATTECRGMGGD